MFQSPAISRLQVYQFGEAEIEAASSWALAVFDGENDQEKLNHKQELVRMLKPQLVVCALLTQNVCLDALKLIPKDAHARPTSSINPKQL